MTRPCCVCPTCGEGKRAENRWCARCTRHRAELLGPRFPVAALAKAAHLSISKLMCRLNISGQAAKRYRAEGIPEAVADRWACKLGFHPAEVWAEWWTVCIDESDAA